ncbi:hypothetical protein [Geodermatophilus sp. DSM 45219]|uniref:hypothetical protein n=1 Tax=Geodermatophilus sp. DSM 45219 TaxID=1881103 RepID=UPI00088B67DE|nr:hypothetical protein [Geodermatophilus sp. DSM 45219]SDN40093.1 hypothetical protein SAMN05428965_0230 [Geodermatophilus sp. DSM 45219]
MWTSTCRASGATRSGALRVAYLGMVTEDGDGPVEVAVPFRGAVRTAGELRVRGQPAGREAVTVLTRAEAGFPRVLDAYDAVARWCEAAGLERSGSPAEVPDRPGRRPRRAAPGGGLAGQVTASRRARAKASASRASGRSVPGSPSASATRSR